MTNSPEAESLAADALLRTSAPATGRGRVWLWAAGVMLVTLIPYLWGATLIGARPDLGVYSWFTFNTTDHCVYLSWMRQAADGHFFQHNLFTTDPQSGHQFNLFFLLLGAISRVTHLSTTCVYQLARLAWASASCGPVVAPGSRQSTITERRRTAFFVVCFSAGLGWIPGLWEMGIVVRPV